MIIIDDVDNQAGLTRSSGGPMRQSDSSKRPDENPYDLPRAELRPAVDEKETD